jgi:hypothetical protein
MAPLPKLVPFIYVQLKLKLRHRAYNTAAAHLRAIQAFYTYAKSRDLDIDEAILASHIEAILALLDGYTSGSKADVKPTTWSPESAPLQRHLFNCSIRLPVASTYDCSSYTCPGVSPVTSRVLVKPQSPWLISKLHLQMLQTSLSGAL